MILKKVTLSLVLGASLLTVKAQTVSTLSPSGNIKLNVQTGEQLLYNVTMNGAVIIKNSPLGFSFKNEPDMLAGFSVLHQDEKEINESWVPVVKSKHARVLNHYKELKLNLIEKAGLQRKMDLEFRVYDDGVAFRYQLYRSERAGNRHITRELTGFNLVANDKAWVADYKGYVSSRESEFIPKLLSSVPDSVKPALPLLIEIDREHYAAITEAKIDNYPGFFIGVDKNGDDGGINLVTKLSPLPLEKEDGEKVRFADKIYTPWRIIMMGKTPGSLIESEIIQNVNDACAIKDPSWIKPGISAWDHWWSGEVKMDMPTIKQYIDFAAKQGWPYMIMDWQWYGVFDKPESNITRAAPQLNMPELLDYAKAKNVRLWLWLNNTDVNRNNNFEEAFALYEKWGIAGVKIDFMDRDDQEMVGWYHEIIKAAADHHLMLDFHGAYKPDGITRTWPNMMTREGVMGNEYNKWSDRVTPQHTTTLPFTRMLAGQMDFTPGGFINVSQAKHQKTIPAQVMVTRCAELAKFVIYESPFTVECDHPDNVLGQPGADFLTIVPTVWDDTHVISGYPGEHIAMVKQTGNRFFVAAMTNSTPRTLKVKLSFLPAGKYELTSWADAKDADTLPTKLVKSTKIVSAADVVIIKMVTGGGFVAELKPVK